MTHIGYIHLYNKETHNGIIIDSNREFHVFRSNKDLDFYQFVTYEGESFCVDEVIPLVDYEVCTEYNPKKTWLIIQKESEGIFLYSKHGTKYEAKGSEYFILRRYCLGQPLLPIEYKDNQYILYEADERANYVSKNRDKIADSYKVFIKSTHFSKIGGDDRFHVDRIVSICYRDLYVDRFFLSSVELDRQSGYTSNFDSPYKDGEDFEEERRGRKYFLSNYNREEHLSYLGKEFSKDDKIEHYNVLKDNLLFLYYWGIKLYGSNNIPKVSFDFFDVEKPLVDSNKKLTEAGLRLYKKYNKSRNGLTMTDEHNLLEDLDDEQYKGFLAYLGLTE